jgi:hypothetical protein
MLYAGLDLSRKRRDFHLLDGEGATVEVGAAPPDANGLCGLSERLARHGDTVRAAIESMNGALGTGRGRHPRLHSTRYATATSRGKRASASSAAPRSRKSTSPVGSPRRSGTCSPATDPSLPKAPPDPLAA